MPVYVDNARIPYGRMKMCHMVADTLEELHMMADRIGLKRQWFQARASTPHYDVNLRYKNRALDNGAIEISRQELGVKLKEIRKRILEVKPPWE